MSDLQHLRKTMRSTGKDNHDSVVSFYRHTQFGTVTVLVLTIGAGLLVRQGVVHAWDPILGAVLALLLVCLVLFHSLTVRVDATHVHIRFGPGPIKRRYALSDVRSVSRVRSKWWHGWGIRWIPGGVLYSVSGLDAVELVMAGGRLVRIGTDQPERLEKEIEQRLVQYAVKPFLKE